MNLYDAAFAAENDPSVKIRRKEWPAKDFVTVNRNSFVLHAYGMVEMPYNPSVQDVTWNDWSIV